MYHHKVVTNLVTFVSCQLFTKLRSLMYRLFLH